MVLSTAKKVQARAVRLANQQMRVDVLPILSRRHPRPNSWNPLRGDTKGPTPYGMKLWLPDSLAMEILRDAKLMEKTRQICVDAVAQAATLEPKDFVTTLFQDLMNDG